MKMTSHDKFHFILIYFTETNLELHTVGNAEKMGKRK